MTSQPEICQYLTWDSEFFNKRIATITQERLTAEQMQAVRDWCAEQAIDCVYMLADGNDYTTIQHLQSAGFAWVDIRIIFEQRLTDLKPNVHPNIRAWRKSDLPELKRIARDGYRDTRFYFDPNFPDEQCDQLYETWIERSCYGFADEVLVYYDQGKVGGFITCHKSGNSGKIGLVGVSDTSRGRGVGTAVVLQALQWFFAHDCPDVTVATQGRNIPAQRLYQRCHFITESVKLWYHGWLSNDGHI
jgi:dTDP-4-amino-4,6-dideoxy-D-galactose acyltransferase